MYKNAKDKGITLTSLIVTVVILLILSTIAYEAGKGTIESARLSAYRAEMTVMQEEVGKLEQSIRQGNITESALTQYGQSLSEVEGATEALQNAGITSAEEQSGYKYYDTDALKKLGIENVENEFLINIAKGSVISLNGVKYKGEKYYTLAEVPGGKYIVENQPIETSVTFDATSDVQENGMKIVISNITYIGNVKKGSIYYRHEEDEAGKWIRAKNETTDTTCTIDVLREGTYQVKVVPTTDKEEKNVVPVEVPVYQANYVIAETGTKYVTLAEAFRDATSGQTITQTRNCADSSDAKITGKSIILNNNNRNITKKTNPIIVESGATLEIAGKGGIVTTDGITAINNHGTLTVGKEADALSTSSPTIQGGNYAIETDGTFNFYNGAIKGTEEPFNTAPTATRERHDVIEGTETINGTLYKTATLGIKTITVDAPKDLAVSTGGIVTWTESENATGYQISIDGTNYTDATSGIDYLSIITETPGEKTIYVKAINSDEENYQSTNASIATVTTNVYTVNFESNDTEKGTVTPTSKNVMAGATYQASGNTLTLEGITSGTNKTTLVTVTATEKNGCNLSGWSSTSGNIISNTTITATFDANPITFENQTKNVTYSTTEQTVTIVGASNGTGTYTYTEKSEKNQGGTDTNYISINGTTITIKENTPADTYTYVVTATDSGTHVTADATITIVVAKQTVEKPTNVAVSTGGIVTWTESENATGYEISIDGTNWQDATSGIDYLNTITNTAGNKTIYVRGKNSDNTNYETNTNSTSTATVTVYLVTFQSNNLSMGAVDTANYKVIRGATVGISENTLTIKGKNASGTDINLKTVRAVNQAGYSFSTWSITNGSEITGATTIIATFVGNELAFSNQTVNKTYSTSLQTAEITKASNGTGTYAYTEKSEKNQGGTDTNYITVTPTTATTSNPTINIAANTPADTYTFVVTATDSGSGKTAEGTITVVVGKADNQITLSETQTWNTTFSTATQTTNVTAATNAQGNVTYTIQSQKDKNSSNVTYFTMPGTTSRVLTMAESAPVNGSSYTVVVRATAAGNSNYKDGYKDITITVNVAKAENPITVTSTQTLTATYSPTAQSKTFTAATNAQGSVTYTIQSQKNTSGTNVNNFTIPTSNSATLGIKENTPVNGSNYTVVVRATAAGSDNYNEGYKDITLTVTIGKATPSLSLNPTSGTIIAGNITTSTITYTGDGSLTASTSSSSVATASISGTTLTITGVGEGTATITVSAGAGANYAAATDATYTITVLAANYSITDSGTTTYYETLATAMATVQNNQTIKVINGVTETAAPTLSSGKTGVKLDMNGKTTTLDNITLTNNGEIDIYSSVDGAKLTGTIANASYGVITNNGTLTTNGTSSTRTLSITNTSNSSSARVLINNESSTATLKTNTTLTFETALSNNNSSRYIIQDYGLLDIQGASLINVISDSDYDRGISIEKSTNTTGRVAVTSGNINTCGMALTANIYGIEKTTQLIKISQENGKTTSITSSKDQAVYCIKGATEITGGEIISYGNAIYSGDLLTISGGNIVSTNGYGIMGSSISISGNTTITGKNYGVHVTDATITGGTISATNGIGIYIRSSGTVTLGVDDGTVISSTTAKPLITGTTFGVNGSGTFNFYDGVVKGAAGKSIFATTVNTPTGYVVKKTTSGSQEIATLSLPPDTLRTTSSETAITSKFLNGTLTRDQIEKVTFVDTGISGHSTSDANCWDVSSRGNGDILAWYEDSDSDGYYEVTIGSIDGRVKANTNSSHLFSYIGKSITAEIDLANLDTSNVTNMGSMFSNCQNVSTIDVSNFNTAAVTNMSSMFYYCKNVATIDVSNFNTAAVTKMQSMFYGCNSLTTLDLSNFDTAAVTNMQLMFIFCSNLTSLNVSNFNTAAVTNMRSMFDNCRGLTSLNVSNFNTAAVTNMSSMFYNCQNVATIDVSNFNTAAVTNMQSMFYGCNSLTTLDLSNFDTHNVSIFGGKNNGALGMFSQCTKLTTIYASEDFVTTAVATEDDGKYMFTGCTNLVGGAGTVYDANHIDHAYAHIDGGTSNPGYFTNGALHASPSSATVETGNTTTINLVGANIGTITIETQPNTNVATVVVNQDGTLTITGVAAGTTSITVKEANKNQTVTIPITVTVPITLKVNLSGSATGAFLGTSITRDKIKKISFATSIAGHTVDNTTCWDVGTVAGNVLMWIASGDATNGYEIVIGQDGGVIANPSSLYLFSYIGYSATAEIDLANFDTSKVTNMSSMFYGCQNVSTLDVSGFDTSNVTTMSDMFRECKNLSTLEVSGFDTSKVTNMQNMFCNCQKVSTLNVSGFDTSNVKDMAYMFWHCQNVSVLDVSGFNTSRVTSMYGMFNSCYNVSALDVSGFATSNVTNMQDMFSDCKNVSILDVSGFDTSNVTNMVYMFHNCKNVSTLDVSGFDTSNVTSMLSMFSYCQNVSVIDVSGFDTSNVTNMQDMFSYCTNVSTLDVSEFDTSNVTDMYSMFCYCTNVSTLDVSEFDTSNVTSMRYMFSNCQNLTTIYATSSFVTTAVTDGTGMFTGDTKLVGGAGTVYDSSHVDHAYAHIDGGTSNPGYFTNSALAADPSSATVNIGSTQEISFKGASLGTITIETPPDSTKATATISNGKLIITGVAAGTTSVTVKEANKNQTVTIPITVINANYSITTASTTTYATTLAEAVTAASSGSTIKLLHDYTDTSSGTISQNVTLDLQTYTLTKSATITVNSGVTATITGSTGSKLTTDAANRTISTIINNGILTIDGDIIIENICNISEQSAIVNREYAILNVKSGTIQSQENGISNNDRGTINIGDLNDEVTSLAPKIIAERISINSDAQHNTLNFYNGILKAKLILYSGLTPECRTGYGIVRGTEDIDGTTYQTAYLAHIYSIDDTTYAGNLTEAVDAANNESTIKLLRDYTDTSSGTIGKNVTLDLQTYTLTRSAAVTTSTGTDVTITGSTGGKLTSGTVNGHTMYNQGTLTIDGSVTIEHNGTNTSYYAIRNATAGAVLNVKSGTITSVTRGIYNSSGTATTNIGDSTQAMNTTNPVIIGGTYGVYRGNGTVNFYSGILKGTTAGYYGTITPRMDYGIVTGTEDIDGTTYNTAYLAHIYSIDDTTYATSLSDAVNIASDGSTIKLLANYTDTVAATINKNVTLDLQTYTLTRTATVTIGSGKDVTITGSTGGKLTSGTANVNTINNQGTLTIDGDATIEHNGTNTSYYAINNATAGGILNVKSGTITSVTRGIYNSSGTATTNIGDSTQAMNTTNPVIIGGTHGVYRGSGTVNFYNGILKGKTKAYEAIANTRTGYAIVTDTEDIDGTTYQTAFLSDSIYSITDSGNTTYYLTLADAVEDATDGQTIKTLHNVVDASTVSISKNITLDLQTYTITRTTTTITISSGYTVDIQGTGGITHGGITLTNNGTLNVTNSTIISNSSGTTTNCGILNNGILTINNGTTIKGVYSGIRNNYGSVTINDGTIETIGIGSSDFFAAINNVSVTNASYTTTVTINGGTIKGGTYGIYNSGAYATTNIGNDIDTLSASTPSITGGEVGVYNNGGTWNFYNGIIMGGSPSAYNEAPSTVRSGYGIATENQVIDGTTYNAAYLEAGRLVLSNTGGTVVEGNSIAAATVTGDNVGTLSAVSGDTSIATASMSGNVLTVTGISEGNTTITVTESNTGKTAVYFITVREANYSITDGGNTVYHNNLAEAIAGATAGQTIKVEKDVEDSTTATVNKNLTLDLQNYTLTRTATITISSGYTLDLKGTGTLTNTSSNISLITNSSGTLNITENTNLSNVYSSGAVYAIDNRDIGTVNITNGIISAAYHTIHNYNCNGTVNISGGTIQTTATTGSRYAIYNYSTSSSYNPKVYITGGTIQNTVGTGGTGYGVYNYGAYATTYVGNNTDTLSTSTPMILGRTNGMYNYNGKWYFYNGVIGSTGTAYNSAPTVVREQYEIASGTKTVDDTTYNTAYLSTASFYVTPRYKSIGIGKTETVTAGGTDYGTLTAVSSSDSIATASVSGTTISITGVAEGNATITVTDTNTGKTDTCFVQVAEPNYSITSMGLKTYYKTLALAIAGANDGDAIKVEQDVTDTSTASFNRNLTLDLQTYTVTRSATVYISSGKDVTITGSTGGKLTSGTANINTINNQGTLTIDGDATIEHNGTSTSYYAINNATAGAVLNVKSGTITSVTRGIYNGNSTATTNIGDATQTMNTTNPVIIGGTHGVYSGGGTVNFYSGILKGKTAGYYGSITTRDGCGISEGTEYIDGTKYKTAILGALFPTDYGTIDVIWLSGTTNTVASMPNAPVLTKNGESMTKVTWTYDSSTSKWSEDATPKSTWYSYNAISTREASGLTTENLTSMWANAKAANGAYFVWIPRYAYRITYYESASSTTPTGYYDGNGMWRASDGLKKYALDSGVETVTYNGNSYIVHPAFETNLDLGGWSSDLSGFWFAKYEMSGDSIAALTSVPNAASKRLQNIGTQYLWGRQATYGYTGTSETLSSNGTNYTYTSYMSSHMMKNSEWGAVAYLTHSQYGRNGNEIDINNCSRYITGNGAGSTSVSSVTVTKNAYNTAIGAKASTTGNIYGIYDMSGGAYDRPAAYDKLGSATYIEGSSYGLNMTQEAKDSSGNYESTKYITAYSNGTTSTYGNSIMYGVGKIGDATKELNKGGNYTTTSTYYANWNTDYFHLCNSTHPFFDRGGHCDNKAKAGVFASSENMGSAGNDSLGSSFRAVLCP